MEIKGTTAVVTGAGSGLGEATARMLVAGGARVGLLDLPSSRGAAVAADLGDAALYVPLDVRDEEAVEAAVDTVATELGGLHVCVNAAGVADAARVLSRDGAEVFPMDTFRRVVDINLLGTFDVLRHACRFMARNEPNEHGERGVVVNVASIAAFEGQAGQAAYSASKGAVAAMTLPLARDLAGWGIRVVGIAPGVFDTGMVAGLGDKVRDRLSEASVFPRRMGRPSDFARFVAAVVENPMLNGEVVRLDAAARLAHG